MFASDRAIVCVVVGVLHLLVLGPRQGVVEHYQPRAEHADGVEDGAGDLRLGHYHHLSFIHLEIGDFKHCLKYLFGPLPSCASAASPCWRRWRTHWRWLASCTGRGRGASDKYVHKSPEEDWSVSIVPQAHCDHPFCPVSDNFNPTATVLLTLLIHQPSDPAGLCQGNIIVVVVGGRRPAASCS